MKAKITPSSIKCRSIQIPPSKSMAHRAIVCASLADGRSVITNVDYSVDIQTTINGMRKLGAQITELQDSVIIDGISSFENVIDTEIECNESGSTLRFFIPIFSLTGKQITFTGSKRLMERPQNVYQEIFSKQGLSFSQEDGEIIINGKLKSQEYKVKGNISSQFISGLCFILPLLKGDSVIRIEAPFESKSYVDLTLQMMNSFGIKAEFSDDCTIKIQGNQKYKAVDMRVESDYSQLGFFAVLGALQGPLDCLGLNVDSLQGDKEIIDILAKMDTKIEIIENGYRVHKANLKGTIIDLNNCPDLGPILTTCSTFAEGETTMINAARLRIKESDRIKAMEDELKKCGIQISSTHDTVTVFGPSEWNTSEILHGHNDHRIVMALAIGATVAKDSIVIDDAQSIRKSYPNFFKDLIKLGIKVELSDD